MSIKSDLKRIDDRLGGDLIVIIASEQLDHRGLFKVHDHDDLGLLTREEVLKRFEREGVRLLIVEYEDNWRGGDHERKE